MTGSVSATEPDPSAFPRLAELARTVEWKRLLHYRAPFLRSERSDIDDPDYFLSPEGKTDPEAELRATVGMFTTHGLATAPHGPLGQPSSCAFPARREFLLRSLGGSFREKLVPIECRDFSEWEKGIAARGVSLVFASAYPNNPASMFGHTFLRLDRGGSGVSRQMDLLSYGVNFSATIGFGDHPVKYALWGLIGGYVGRYDLSPYYRKVNEYAFSESRDLWEYRLSFSPEEVAQLVRHVWELYGQGGLRYYFLDENCSFQILTALEAVRPDWELSSGFMLSAIPVETVRHVARTPGAVTAVLYRPSLRNQMGAAIARLPAQDRRLVADAFSARGKEGPRLDSLSSEALDAFVLALAYEKESGGENPDRAALLRAVLLERSKRGSPTAPVPSLANDGPPDSAHPTSRLTLGYGSERGRRRIELGFAGFRHDFLDRTPSYNLFSEVRVFDLRVRHLEGERIRFDRIDLFAMSSLAPDSLFDAQNSWKIELGWGERPDSDLLARGWHFAGGYGLGAPAFGRRGIAYALLHGDASRAGMYREGWGFFPGFDLGWVASPVPGRVFFHLRALPRWDVFNSVPGGRFRPLGEFAVSGWLTDAIDVRIRVETQKAGSTDRWRRRFGIELATRF